MKTGQKHLIKCRCILPQFKKLNDPPAHQFLVFSVINEDQSVEPKFSQCNNCGIIHKVIDICKSEILQGKESLKSIINLEDIKVNLSEKLVAVLERYEIDQPTYEQVLFIVQNKQWGDFVVLSSEIENGVRHGKYLIILGESLFRIESFSKEEYATNE